MKVLLVFKLTSNMTRHNDCGIHIFTFLPLCQSCVFLETEPKLLLPLFPTEDEFDAVDPLLEVEFPPENPFPVFLSWLPKNHPDIPDEFAGVFPP